MKVFAVIVDLGPGVRRLDSNLSSPAALISIDGTTPVLNWARAALQANDVRDILYVGGYHIKKILAQFPDVAVRYEPEWTDEGRVRTIQSLPVQSFDSFLFLRSDVVVTNDTIHAMLNSHSPHLSGQVGTATETQVAAVLLPSSKLLEISAGKSGASDQDGLNFLAHGAASVDLSSRAAFAQDSASLTRILFPGKAQTLTQLGSVLRSLDVVDQFRFSIGEWNTRPAGIVKAIKARFPDGLVIVRSSASTEDSPGASHAGYFKSVANIRACSDAALIASVDEVGRSFTRDGRATAILDEIFVQPQITDIDASGVMFTRDLTTRAPYFAVSLERATGRSDAVTAGLAGEMDTYYVAWTASDRSLPSPAAIAIGAGRELVSLTGLDAIDVEFALGRDGRGYLFQARPLSNRIRQTCADSDLLESLAEAKLFVASKMARSPGLCGATTLFSNMADWNPAEMLGPAPKTLALSLYQNVIGADVWAKARAMLGYRDATPSPLVISVAGRPYIDVRASLNSFLPAGLDDSIGEKWVDSCIAFLRARPALHDKIEFEITPTCYTEDWNRYASRMNDAGLSQSDIDDYRRALIELSGAIVAEKRVSIDSLLSKLGILRERRREILDNTERDSADRVLRLLSDCRTFGTLPFAMLARCAFIAMSVLRSMDASSAATGRSLPGGIPTILDDILRDIRAARDGRMERHEFIERYGHLRPDSYEITAPNYAEAIDAILAGENAEPPASQTHGQEHIANLFEKCRDELDALCLSLDCDINRDKLQSFVERSIAARELAKFEFMKSIDAILSEITAFGRSVGLERDDLSHLAIDDILQFATNSRSGATVSRLKRLVGYRRKRAAITSAVRLPDLICSSDEILAFKQQNSTPNFVTQGSTGGEPVYLTAENMTSSLEGKIVLIGSGDPGYDWIFSRAIGGLVTQYGGIGSHMAVRAAELGLPAAIGVGPVRFSALKSSSRVQIDCARQSITWR